MFCILKLITYQNIQKWKKEVFKKNYIGATTNNDNIPIQYWRSEWGNGVDDQTKILLLIAKKAINFDMAEKTSVPGKNIYIKGSKLYFVMEGLEPFDFVWAGPT